MYFLSGRAAAVAVKKDANLTLLKVFLAFQISGGIGLLAVLLTVFLSHKIYRHFTWVNFCFTWIIYCVSYILLGISGEAATSRELPSYPLCLAQASLIYAAPVLAAMSTFALVLQLWFTLKHALNPPKVPQSDRLRNMLLLVSPYVFWLGFVVTILSIGSLHPQLVQLATPFIYCTIAGGIPGDVAAVFVAATLLTMVAIDTYIGVVLYRNWRALRGSDHPAQIPLSLIARVAIFSFVCIVGIGCAFVFLWDVSYFAGNTIIALMPLIAFLVFGTQKDILKAWFFWRH